MNGADKFARDAFGNDAEYYFTHEFTKPAAQIGNTPCPESILV